MITEAGLTGTWVSDGGARIRFAADRTMSGSGLDKALVGVLADCPVSLSGRWSFHSPVDRQGGRYADDTFTKGETLTLSTGDAPADCAWEAQVRRDQQGWNLCLTPDLDSLCGATELLRRDEGRLP
ncbi:hypothetical protein ACIQUQ_27650 [Streptomyces sp. NPDC101118]|uniref:hypothetical protein n=1 Tax=Streptomyces sp. NPDC101118 TaxID=3366109 RepID=UPI00380A0BB7